MKTLLLAGLLLATAVWPVAAQQRLTGKILDAATGQPVPYASIGVLNTTAGTTSNAEGEFELRIPLPSRLVVSELGHRRDTVAVAAAAAPLLVRLQPAAVALPEVTTGTYTEELIKQAYRELRRTNARHEYGHAFYRQVTYLAGEATEVQEMVWDAASSNAGTEGSAIAQGRFAKVKALLSFRNFSVYTKMFSIFDRQADSTNIKGLFGPRVAEYFDLKLLGVTSNGPQQLVEVGFAGKAGNPNQEKGSAVIDAQTKQVLRLRIDTPGFHVKSNNPLFKFQDEQMHIEWVFQSRPSGAATLEYLKVSYQSTLTRPLKSNVPVRASSFTYFYDGRRTPDASVTYAPAKSGEADLAAIKQTTYDPAFWQNNPVVKRTPLEEQVMKSFEQKGAFGTMLTP